MHTYIHTHTYKRHAYPGSYTIATTPWKLPREAGVTHPLRALSGRSICTSNGGSSSSSRSGSTSTGDSSLSRLCNWHNLCLGSNFAGHAKTELVAMPLGNFLIVNINDDQ